MAEADPRLENLRKRLVGGLLFKKYTHFSVCPYTHINTLQRKSHWCIPFLGIARTDSVLIFHTHLSVSDLYSSRIGLHISSSRIGRPIVGIYKSLTDTWMWKLGLRPRYSFSGNICFEFSGFCLWSVLYNPQSNDWSRGPAELVQHFGL